MTNREPNGVTAAYDEYRQRIGAERIPCYEPLLGGREIELVTDVLTRGWLSEGQYVREFEQSLASICARRHALAFANATSAMIAALRGCDIGPGDGVIVPTLAHAADANVVAACGATPQFADSAGDTLCLSVDTIEAARTDKTRAILYVAAYGNTDDLEAIERYADRHGLLLANDCAAALFGTFRARPIASFGRFAALSFYADKTITTGEGGMLLTDDAALSREANTYKHDGRRERGIDVIERQGYNFRITDLQAAIGVAQLERREAIIRRKREVLRLYREHLDGVEAIRLFQFNAAAAVVPHRIIVFAPRAEPLIRHLESRAIGARTLFMPLHSQPAYGDAARFPVAESLYERGVCLPSAPTLTDDDVRTVCSAIRSFYDSHGNSS